MQSSLHFGTLSFNVAKVNQPIQTEGNFQSVTLETVNKPRRVDPTATEAGYWQKETLGDVYFNTHLIGTSDFLKTSLQDQTVPEGNSDGLKGFIRQVLNTLQPLPQREQRKWFGSSEPALEGFNREMKPAIETFLETAKPFSERRVVDGISIFFETPPERIQV